MAARSRQTQEPQQYPTLGPRQAYLVEWHGNNDLRVHTIDLFELSFIATRERNIRHGRRNNDPSFQDEIEEFHDSFYEAFYQTRSAEDFKESILKTQYSFHTTFYTNGDGVVCAIGTKSVDEIKQEMIYYLGTMVFEGKYDRW